MPSATPTYWDYLKLDRLLALQGGLEEDESRLMPDELHFIVVHQAFELWFKLILREVRLARDHLAEPRVPEESIPYVVHHLRRVNRILRHAAEQFVVMETLTPQDFLGFRDKLTPASGFQSFQLREIEILLGLDDAQRLQYGQVDPLDHIRRTAAGSPGGAAAWARIERARAETSLKAALNAWLFRTPIQGSVPDNPGDEAAVDRFLSAYVDSVRAMCGRQAETLSKAPRIDPGAVRARFEATVEEARRFLFGEDVPEGERRTVRRSRAGLVFIESYRELPLLAWPRLLIDAIVEAEELLVLWRTHHARMVERIIGRRVGTGGSSGVEYLDRTTQVRIFTDLWAVRTLLLPKAEVPVLENPAVYGFAT